MKPENIGSTLDSLFDELGEPRPRVPILANLERAAFKALEEAWVEFGRHGRSELDGLVRDLSSYLAARRSARDAGMVSVMVSQDTLTMLHFGLQWMDERNFMPTAVRQAMGALACDCGIAAVLKPDGQP